MSDVAELSVVIKGKEVGLKSLLTAIERGLKQTDAAAKKTTTELDKLATAEKRAADEALRDAQALARLDAAQGNTAGGAARLRAALDANGAASVRVRANIETQIAKMESAATQSNRLAGELTGLAASYVSVGAVIGGTVAAIQSFADAINFKAKLDTTTQSINIQLNGVRDTGQVWNEAAAYANKYKLTQAQTAATVQASVGILRQSNASIEETFGVLQRLTVLAPGKTIEDAAFSVRELASGDITSIAEQFNLSRKEAYAMRDAIASGADVVTVLSQYLDRAGVSMETLKVQTEGVLGAQKDLAIAQEQLALAQADFATGPGMVLLRSQIELTRDATRLLSGDFTALGDAINDSGLGSINPLLGALANYNNAVLSAGEGALRWAGLIRESGDAATQAQVGYNGAAIVAREQGIAAQESGDAALAAAAASESLITKLTDEADKKRVAADEALKLAALQRDLASLGGQVAAGLITSGDAADILRSKYGGAADEAARLLSLQIQIAQGEARIAAQGAQTRNLVPGGVGFNTPGRGKGTDADILSTIAATQAQLVREETKGQTGRTGAAKTGGRARVDTEAKTAQQLEDLERDHQAKLADIAAAGAQKRLEAENALKLAQLRGRAGFYASLASIDDNALRQDLSARYEAAAQEAGRIAQEQGADAAQAYLEASQKAIEGEAQLRQDIAAAEKEGDAGKAEYLKGLLALQQAADAEELRQIQEQGSAVANELDARYAAEEQAYREHLDRMAADAAARGVTLGATLPGPPATGTPAARPATGSGSGTTTTSSPETGGKAATVVSDPATQGAVEVSGGRLEGAINAVRDAIGAVERRVGDVEGAVRSLKSSGIKG